jgi:hypothetical protein
MIRVEIETTLLFEDMEPERVREFMQLLDGSEISTILGDDREYVAVIETHTQLSPITEAAR